MPSDPSSLPAPPASFESELATHPHDAYFKRVFSDPAHAAALLRQHLPEDVAAAIRFDQLSLVPGSFIKNTLKQSHSDLLFRAPASDGEVLVYILFEHQTTVDRAMPLRLLSYMTEIWLQCEDRDGLPLPAILPFVLHQGPQRWTASTSFAGLIGVPQHLAGAFAPYLPQFRHVLLDLSQADPSAEESDGTVRAVLQLMKLSRQQQVMEFFLWLVSQTASLPEELLTLSLLYALHSDENLDVESLGRILLPNPHLQKTAMSLAQKLRQEGMALGEKLGRERGLWLGKVQVLQEMLGIATAPVTEDATIEQLQERFRMLQSEYDRKFKTP